VVIFVEFRESGERIARELGCEFLNGQTPTHQRQPMVDRFQQSEYRAIVCTFGAGGVGISLTSAQVVILVDRPWTPGDVAQAEDRLHRIHQRNAVTSIWLQLDETDTAIDQLLQTKSERIEIVLRDKSSILSSRDTPAQIASKLLPALLGK
jgi:SNF2 family DNA or RNA helicase